MKVLVIGAEGQLGQDVCSVFQDADLHTADIDGDGLILDLRDREAVTRLVTEELRPELVINTAAFHNVPNCETETEMAYAVNATAVRDLAVACHEAGARLLHISTDYVFGWGGTRPYVESDPPAPLSTYAASKLAGEHLLAAECTDYIIIRSSGLYGSSPCRAKGGDNFVRIMLHLAETRGEVKVVTDEVLTPTYTAPLAKQIRLVAEQGEPGLYHATCNGSCSWHEFTQAIFELASVDAKLFEATSDDFPSVVKRPSYSVLENKHLQDQGLDIMPHWRDALKDYIEAGVG